MFKKVLAVLVVLALAVLAVLALGASLGLIVKASVLVIAVVLIFVLQIFLPIFFITWAWSKVSFGALALAFLSIGCSLILFFNFWIPKLIQLERWLDLRLDN